MKKVGIIVAAVVCIALICTGFYFAKSRSDEKKDEALNDIEKVITRDLDGNYPKTPREVIKLYNRIIEIYYDAEYSDEDFEQLTGQALKLFDEELAANNPKSAYQQAVRMEVKDYEKHDKSIRSSSVCDSRDVVYLTDPDNGDELAYVTASYFIKEGNSFVRTHQQYVLREDEAGNWKILAYYQIEGKPSED